MIKTACSLEVETLSSGCRLVRPAGSLGTCGWRPRGWIAVYVRRGETPRQAFLRGNLNWTSDMIEVTT